MSGAVSYDCLFPPFLPFDIDALPLARDAHIGKDGRIPVPEYQLGWMMKINPDTYYCEGYGTFAIRIASPRWRDFGFGPPKDALFKKGLSLPEPVEVDERHVLLRIARTTYGTLRILRDEESRRLLIDRAFQIFCPKNPDAFDRDSTLIWMRNPVPARSEEVEYPCVGELLGSPGLPKEMEEEIVKKWGDGW